MWRTLTHPRFLLCLMVGGGMFLRGWHYVADHTIWDDESVVLLNVMEKDYAGLTGPLGYAVAAPPLFLWTLKTLWLALGDHKYVWRAVPFLFSVGGVLLAVPLARQVFPPHLAAFAVGLVAVSDSHVWLGCNIKPYASDTFFVTGMLLFVAVARDGPLPRRLLLLAAVIPPVFAFSYPAVLAATAALLVLSPAAWRSGWRGRLAWGIAALVAAGTFALLRLGPMTAQRSDRLVSEWHLQFPDFADPLSVPWWVVQHTLGVFVFACRPTGLVLGLLAPLGGWWLWKNDRRVLLAACGLLFALALVAAALKTYPYGEHRLSQFLAPAVMVMGAAGVAQVARWRKWVGVGVAAVVLGVADGLSLYRLARPWEMPAAESVRRHVQTHRRPGDGVYSNYANYSYLFFGEVRPLGAITEVPPGGRAWVVVDFFVPDESAQGRLEGELSALGVKVRERAVFHRAEAWLCERTVPGEP